jgi:malate dehydrogenase (oxaloacetate-decarboxylating)(NADP+)
VILSGFTNAARLSSAASGLPPSDQKILFLGAGSAGIGVAKQLLSFFTLSGMSPEEARSRIYVSQATFEGHLNLSLIEPVRLLIQKVL